MMSGRRGHLRAFEWAVEFRRSTEGRHRLTPSHRGKPGLFCERSTRHEVH